ncbi:MAG TPA: hypothetical protein VJA21_05630 [Verrucomicrobiae bacterium]
MRLSEHALRFSEQESVHEPANPEVQRILRRTEQVSLALVWCCGGLVALILLKLLWRQDYEAT